MLCALSGKDAVEPVVSAVSGKVYERSVIETWVTERGTDPATGAPLAPAQLVRLDVAPANPAVTIATSIPALLQGLQTEFNALALENFELRTQAAQQRDELAAAQQRVDAALRVITRLSQERDELRHALSELDIALPPRGASASGAEAASGGGHRQTPRGQGTAAAGADNGESAVAAARTPRATDEAQMDVDVDLDDAAGLAEHDAVAPSEAVPNNGVPSAAVPSDAVPSDAVPSDAAANDGVASDGVSSGEVPSNAADPDLTGEGASDSPQPPRLEPAAALDISAARKTLTERRRQFNSAAARVVFGKPAPRVLPARGDALQIAGRWAVVASSSGPTLYDLRSRAPVDVVWSHPVRNMSLLDAGRLALLSTRRLALYDLAAGDIVKDVAVQGNPLEALAHPAGPLMVRYSGRIEAYAADTLAVDKQLSLSVPKCIAFALHPDGEFLIYYSGAAARTRTLVFYSLVRREEVLAVATAGPVRSIVASVNGYHVAYFDGAELAILDLRSDDAPVKHKLPASTVPRQLSFDSTGRRLLVSSPTLVLQYTPQDGQWTEEALVHDAAADAVAAWSGAAMQVPVFISAASA